MRLWTVKYLLIFAVSFLGGVRVFAQGADTAKRAVADTSLPPNIPRPVYGPYDTIIVPAKIYDGELLSVDEQEEASGAISGDQKEMDDVLKSLKEGLPW